MGRNSWHKTWLKVSQDVAGRSLCSRAQVGAVVVDDSNRIIATGYNGPPAGYDVPRDENGEPLDCSHWCPRAITGEATLDYANCPAVHAETNCLLFADKKTVENGAMYITTAPCNGCVKIVANSGVKTIAWLTQGECDRHRIPENSKKMLDLCGIDVIVVEDIETL